MLSFQPEAGIQVPKKTLNQNQITSFQQTFPQDIIIRICGFAGAGKGTLSKQLANILHIPNIESSLILRGITYGFVTLDLSFSKENTQKVLEKLNVNQDSEGNLIIAFNNQVLTKTELRSPEVDKSVAYFSSLPEIREEYYKLLGKCISNSSTSCILDGRGVYPPYIKAAREAGKCVVLIFLDCSNQVKADRFIAAYAVEKQKTDPNFILSSEEKERIYNQYVETYDKRNQQDYETWINLDIGVTTEDTGIIDTSDMTVEEVTHTALSFIQEQISKTGN